MHRRNKSSKTPKERQDCIKTLIEDALSPVECSSTKFIGSALKAALSTPSPRRRSILADVADVLSCAPEELDFMFLDPVYAANDVDPVGFPDYRQTLSHDQLVLVAY